MTAAYQVSERWVCLGIDEDFDTCECCGRSGLKKTIVMGIRQAEGGDTEIVGRFGCVCAARHSGLPAARVRVLAKTAQDEKELASCNAEGARVAALLASVQPPAPTVETDATGRTVIYADGITVYSYSGITPERLECFRESWLSDKVRAAIGAVPAWVRTMPPSSWKYEACRAALRMLGSKKST
jgi:hypothetical protein